MFQDVFLKKKSVRWPAVSASMLSHETSCDGDQPVNKEPGTAWRITNRDKVSERHLYAGSGPLKYLLLISLQFPPHSPYSHKILSMRAARIMPIFMH